MKGKANASIFSFQGHIIILRLLSFFIKVFICFISNSPDFKIWILWLQPNFTITPFQGLSGSIVASSASDTRCTFSNDFAFFVLKEKKLWWKQVHNFEFMQIKHLVRWKCCLTLTIPWNTNSLSNWNHRGKYNRHIS